jgi:hypothetical protein
VTKEKMFYNIDAKRIVNGNRRKGQKQKPFCLCLYNRSNRFFRLFLLRQRPVLRLTGTETGKNKNSLGKK